MMSETKFTPGPWQVSEETIAELDSPEFIIGQSGDHGAVFCEEQIASVWGPEHDSFANANLIAAAPELYDEHIGWSELIGRVFVMLQQAEYSEAIGAIHDAVTVDFSSGQPIALSEVLAKARGEQ